MFKRILDFIFDSEEKELNSAQIETLQFLATKVYMNLYGNDYKTAQKFAYKAVNNWVQNGKTDKALKMLWESGIA